MRQLIRTTNAYLLIPVLKITGFRFSKHYRWGSTKYHSIVYNLVDTVLCNIKAGI